MRPCLEDFLEFVVRNCGCGFDSLPGWQAAIVEGRERWPRKQIGSVVRDVPSEAVRVLEELGYEVRPPASSTRPDRNDQLRQW